MIRHYLQQYYFVICAIVRARSIQMCNYDFFPCCATNIASKFEIEYSGVQACSLLLQRQVGKRMHKE